MSEQYVGHPFQQFGHISYSQHGEDLMILTLFKDLGIDKPSYMDIGAYHPINISNTHLMYLRGSRGINVEPNPYLYKEFFKHRPEDINLNMAVWFEHVDHDLSYYMVDRESPCNTLYPTELADNNLIVSEVETVQVALYSDILEIYNNSIAPDFLNIDIEGLDYMVLKHSDFIRFRPKIIYAEAREPDRMASMMRDNDYKEVIRLAGNILFMDKKL